MKKYIEKQNIENFIKNFDVKLKKKGTPKVKSVVK